MAEAKFKIDIYGDTAKFENSLKGINSAMTALKGEASQLRKDLKFDPSNTTKMAQLQKNYAQQLEQTRNKVTSLKKELSSVDKTTPDGQKKFIKLSKDIQDAELKAGYLEKDIKSLESAIDSGNFNIKLETSDSETKVANLKSRFNALKEVAIGVFREIGASAVRSLGNAFSGWIDDTKATQKAMISLQNVMKFKGNDSGFSSLSKQMQKLATDTNANTEDTLKLASTFIGLGDSAKTAGSKVENIVKANQAFGGTSEDLKGVTQAYSQMSAAGKVSAENINQLTDNNTALGSALKSTVMEMNPTLKQFGSFSEASSKGKVSIEMLDKALAKMGQSSGGGVETIDDAMASLNETISIALLPALDSITPIITRILNSIAEMVPVVANAFSKMFDTIKNSEWLKQLLDNVGKVIEKFKEFKKWIEQGSAGAEVMKSVIVGLTASLTGLLIIEIITKLFKGLSAGITTARIAFQILNTTLKANAIYLIISAIVALVAGLVYFFTKTKTGQKLWKQFSEFVVKAVQKIAKWCIDTWNKISSATSNVVSKIKGFWEKLTSSVSNVFNGIKSSADKVINPIAETFSKIVSRVKEILNPLKIQYLLHLKE